LLGALGLALAIVDDNEALRKVQDRLIPRRAALKRADRSRSWFTSENAREMAKKRAAKMTPEERNKSASRAARARWRRPKLVAAEPAI
jgi:hypothetical protein